MSDIILKYRNRIIREEDVRFLRQVIADHPELNRRRLSKLICELWDWRQPNGYLKEMVCRGLMLALQRSGHIELPPAKPRNQNQAAICRHKIVEFESLDQTRIEGSVKDLGLIEIRLVRRREGEDLFAYLIEKYHYLGYKRPVGEHLKYLVEAQGRPIACMAWSSAPLKLKMRDEWVGAHRSEFEHRLSWIVYNTRFLLVPWVRVPHLASHLLGRIIRRIDADWRNFYNHPVVLLETFVDTERFKGTCYQAANWKWVGFSSGAGTRSKTHHPTVAIKEYWVYPLVKDLKTQLTGGL